MNEQMDRITSALRILDEGMKKAGGLTEGLMRSTLTAMESLLQYALSVLREAKYCDSLITLSRENELARRKAKPFTKGDQEWECPKCGRIHITFGGFYKPPSCECSGKEAVYEKL